jgi:hypothetical protein
MSDTKNDYHKKVYNVDNWQKLHVQQLSYTRNLVIILASAALGYTLSLLDNNLSHTIKMSLKIISLFYLTSIAIGVLIAYTESKNYRLKYYISRKIEKSQPFEEEEKQCTAIEYKNKWLIKTQLLLFGIAITAETILLIVR